MIYILDNDECDIGSYMCSEKAICRNVPGSYQCECMEGFSGNGIYCTGKSFYSGLFERITEN